MFTWNSSKPIPKKQKLSTSVTRLSINNNRGNTPNQRTARF
jgi:hypothetical protein